jgi:hypothetical protein
MLARLALATPGEMAGAESAEVPIDDRTRKAAHGSWGKTVLLYYLVPETFVVFYGTGKVSGLNIGSDGQGQFCQITDVHRFELAQYETEELLVPRVQHLLSLSVERFGQLLKRGERDGETFEDLDAQDFRGPVDKPLRQMHEEVLTKWGYRCALTGRQFTPAPIPHPHLHLTYIQPPALGGPLHVRNLMPLTEAARDAWECGAISAADDFRVLAALDGLDADLLGSLHLLGKLLVPADRNYQPDPACLAFHRATIMGASRG